MLPIDLPGLIGIDTRCDRRSKRRDKGVGKPNMVVGGVA